jgi:vitamin K-dependent gamma-carboxylase
VTLWQRLQEPIDAASVVWFRIAFGALIAFECVRYLGFGWVRDYWVEPTFYFTFYGFDWVTPWPGIGMYVHFVALIVLGLAISAGIFYRAAAALFTVGFAYVFLLDQAQYLNHFYAIILFALLLAVIPAHVDASVDAKRNPQLRSSTVPAWTLWALRAQMGFIYFWGGVAKLNGDWLQGQPLTLWLQTSPHLPDFMKGDAGLYLSWGGAAFDLLIVPALLWKRTRAAALVLAIAFHAGNAWMFHIGVFPWMSIAATVIFLRPDHPFFTTTIENLRLDAPARRVATSRVVTALVGVWLVSQVVLPLRPLLNDSHTHWTEDGHMFSWRMKLRGKDATGNFWVQRPGESQRERVDSLEHLTDRQFQKMLPRPDMLIQYAHHLAQLHGPGTEVYAQVFASLNGRRAAPFVDDTVDLAREIRSPGTPSWVLPFEDTPIMTPTDQGTK